jgi:phage baseplate assembly protein gpV
MSVEHLFNTFKRGASEVVTSLGVPRFGTVTSTDPTRHAVKVQIQPEGVLTGWLPCGSASVGPATIVSPPTLGDQVVLVPLEGDAEHWAIIGRVFSAASAPPVSPATGKPVQAGEVRIFTAGAWLHFAGGNVYGAATAWNLTGNVAVTGAITATGDITAGFGGSDQVDLQQHDHEVDNVEPGNATLTTTAPVAGT